MKKPHYDTSIKVRPITANEMDAAVKVCIRAFDCAAYDWYDDAHVLGAFTTDNKLVASLGCKPLPMLWGDAAIPSSAVGGVATDPDERKKGYAGALMVGTFNYLRDNGWHTSPLWPFSFAYYRKFGWEIPNRDLRMRACPDMLRALGDLDEHVRKATLEDKPGIEKAYAAAARQLNCLSLREAEWWDKKEQSFYDNMLVHVDAAGVIDGYLHYTAAARHQAIGMTIDVVELLAEELGAQVALARAAAEIPDADTITFTLPSNSLLPELMPDHIFIESPKRLMVRVVDPAKALESLKPGGTANAKLAFEISDWMVSDGKPIQLLVDVEDGNVKVRTGTHSDAIACDITGFSRLFTGGIDTDLGRTLGLVSGGNVVMDKACNDLLHGRPAFRSMLEPG